MRREAGDQSKVHEPPAECERLGNLANKLINAPSIHYNKSLEIDNMYSQSQPNTS